MSIKAIQGEALDALKAVQPNENGYKLLDFNRLATEILARYPGAAPRQDLLDYINLKAHELRVLDRPGL